MMQSMLYNLRIAQKSCFSLNILLGDMIGTDEGVMALFLSFGLRCYTSHTVTFFLVINRYVLSGFFGAMPIVCFSSYLTYITISLIDNVVETTVSVVFAKCWLCFSYFLCVYAPGVRILFSSLLCCFLPCVMFSH